MEEPGVSLCKCFAPNARDNQPLVTRRYCMKAQISRCFRFLGGGSFRTGTSSLYGLFFLNEQFGLLLNLGLDIFMPLLL